MILTSLIPAALHAKQIPHILIDADAGLTIPISFQDRGVLQHLTWPEALHARDAEELCALGLPIIVVSSNSRE